MNPSRFSPVKFIPRDQITTDPKSFQGRQVAFALETVNKIVREGYDKSQDPIIVWFDSLKNKYIVISGHSRWEASVILFKKGDKTLKNMPVKVFLGDKDSAIEYAVLESNRSGTEEGFKSDLKAFKIAKAKGYNRDKLLSLFKPESKLRLLQDLSYLNENGLFLEYIGTSSEKSFPYIQRNAQWVGNLRKTFPQLTNLHETELFNYLYDKKKTILITKDKFFNLVNSKVQTFDFKPSNALNLNNVISKNAVTDPARAKIREIQAQIDELVKDRSRKEELTVKAKEQGKTELLPKFKTDIEGINSLLLRRMEEKRKLESSIANVEKHVTTDLFSQPAGAPVAVKHSPTVTTAPQNISERIQKEAAEQSLKEINKNGFIRAADPVAVANKIKKYTGIEVIVTENTFVRLAKKINWKAKLSDKQKKALTRGINLMEKAKKLQKETGTITKTFYKMPIQKALKIVSIK
jgi:hypothetical protein